MNCDWKMPLTDPVCYVGDKAECAAVSWGKQKRRKCHMNCVGGIPERSVTTKIVWASGKRYNNRRFSTQEQRRRTKETAEQSLDLLPLWVLVLCQTGKCWEVEEAWVVRVSGMWGESKMTKYISIMLDARNREVFKNRHVRKIKHEEADTQLSKVGNIPEERKRCSWKTCKLWWLDVLMWLCISLAKAERSRKAESFHRKTLPSRLCVRILIIFDLLLLYQHVNFG